MRKWHICVYAINVIYIICTIFWKLQTEKTRKESGWAGENLDVIVFEVLFKSEWRTTGVCVRVCACVCACVAKHAFINSFRAVLVARKWINEFWYVSHVQVLHVQVDRHAGIARAGMLHAGIGHAGMLHAGIGHGGDTSMPMHSSLRCILWYPSTFRSDKSIGIPPVGMRV